MDATFLEIASLTEDQAREYLERIRWPNGPGCPRCGDMAVTKLQGKSTRSGVYKCKGCRKPFTVTVGTIFEGSHIKLKKWLLAFHLICSSKKGISALQLQRMLQIGSYKSAWFMAHRIRYAMRQEPLAGMLKGTVEADETYIGGKPRRKGTGNQTRKDRQKAVMALVERGGKARSFPLKRVTKNSLGAALLKNVDMSARIMTDEHAGYPMVARFYKGGHHTVKHSANEYARGDVYTNTAESYFALLKRGIMGAFHHVSEKHLPRYCDEFDFRWNHRETTDGERTMAALQAAEGKRLMYRLT